MLANDRRREEFAIRNVGEKCCYEDDHRIFEKNPNENQNVL